MKHPRILFEETKFFSHFMPTDGEHSDYQEELEINEVDKQTGKLILREEQSDSNRTLNEKSELEKLIDYGIDKSVAVELIRFFKDKNISYDSLDETETPSEFSLNDAKLMITLVLKKTSSYTDPSMSLPGPDKLKEILKETEYALKIIPGNKRYVGPPPDYKSGPPRHANEVKVSCIIKIGVRTSWFHCSKPLEQFEIRLPIVIQTGYNKRYCFVSYYKKDLSAVGIKDVFVCYTPEMQEIDLKNNGYCYVDYEDHKQTAAAKEDLERVGSRLLGPNIVADWANPEDSKMTSSCPRSKLFT
ncbi:hypothetical protein CHS0354_013929 [Potamilus streckersoni]|uniref:Uncharacterized protein n=1 Tax=Potamilus streckersoni TaxID=2493646 RepID=A0AAE0RWM2_9BIVA|nr:hypothetical protein CHS0354_013929 [Potamilus streckersoni]